MRAKIAENQQSLDQKEQDQNLIKSARSFLSQYQTARSLKLQYSATKSSISQEKKDKAFMADMHTKQKNLISEQPKRQQIFYIFHMILNQRRLSYNICLALGYYFRCLVCRRSQSLRQRASSKTDFYLDRGVEKLSRDLDIVNLLDMIRGFHVMKQVLFSQDERFLLHLQHRDMIQSSDSAPQNDDNGSDLENILNQEDAAMKPD